tara:strand:+ start:514 stop:780 length:267 start_codon:yes stop_codon:yes gene_type:complete
MNKYFGVGDIVYRIDRGNYPIKVFTDDLGLILEVDTNVLGMGARGYRIQFKDIMVRHKKWWCGSRLTSASTQPMATVRHKKYSDDYGK